MVPLSEGAHQQRVRVVLPARRIIVSESIASGATPSPRAAPLGRQGDAVPTITQDDDEEDSTVSRNESESSLPRWMQNYVARA